MLVIDSRSESPLCKGVHCVLAVRAFIPPATLRSLSYPPSPPSFITQISSHSLHIITILPRYRHLTFQGSGAIHLHILKYQFDPFASESTNQVPHHVHRPRHHHLSDHSYSRPFNGSIPSRHPFILSTNLLYTVATYASSFAVYSIANSLVTLRLN